MVDNFVCLFETGNAAQKIECGFLSMPHFEKERKNWYEKGALGEQNFTCSFMSCLKQFFLLFIIFLSGIVPLGSVIGSRIVFLFELVATIFAQ